MLSVTVWFFGAALQRQRRLERQEARELDVDGDVARRQRRRNRRDPGRRTCR